MESPSLKVFCGNSERPCDFYDGQEDSCTNAFATTEAEKIRRLPASRIGHACNGVRCPVASVKNLYGTMTAGDFVPHTRDYYERTIGHALTPETVGY